MIDLAVALALVLVIEGLLWAAFPDRMKDVAAQAATLPSSLLRRVGLVAMAVGVVIVWFVRGG
ncbi:MAG: DUF2065 family protein [Alphaproteobacteria bacterium]|jgi:uncharacterized protein YjeT (DUF2065 family)|nr:DUF2065 family protein [Alphaproteobacteria bacterium]